MPHLSQTGLIFGYMAGNSSSPTPTSFIIPQDALIAYYGSNPELTDWTIYAPGTGYYIRATTTQGAIGTVTAGTVGGMNDIQMLTGNGPIGSLVHIGVSEVDWLQQNITTFGSYRNEYSSAGTHVHTISLNSPVDSSGLYPPTANVTLLRANKNTSVLPTNSLIFSQYMPNDNAIPMTGMAYLKGVLSGAGTVDAGISSKSVVATLSTSGQHTHLTPASQIHPTSLQTSGTSITISSTNNPAAGGHTHPTTLVFSQSGITSRLLKLWKIAINSVPTRDIILMYAGDLSLLPQDWYVCDGTNGTVNINSLIVGYNDQTGTWNITTSPITNATTSTSTNSDSHTHLLPTVTGRYLATTVAGASSDYHGVFQWTHSHTIFSNVTPYTPASINVAFIQYKGNPVYTPTSPINTVLPAITGTPIAGSVLTCSTGTWSTGSSGSPITYTYQWIHGITNISGATSNTLTLGFQQYVGETIQCAVTATNYAGSTLSVTTTTAPVAPVVTGEVIYTTGSGTWVCPAGVTSITVICVGAGGGSGNHGGGGGGGALSYGNNIAVVPGTSYNYTVGAGVNFGNGGNTTFNTTWIVAGGGKVGNYGNNNTGGGGGGAGGYDSTKVLGQGGAAVPKTGSTTYAGGAGGLSSGTYRSDGAAGAIGGQGHSVSTTVAAAGTAGGGGGGGGAGGWSQAFGGGGVGLYGQGTNGIGGAAVTIAGNDGVAVDNGGSGGGRSYGLPGGIYGGGAGGGVGNAAGGPGAIRIIWPGQFRSFPLTNTSIL